MFLKNKNIIFKIRRSKVTDYAALRSVILLQRHVALSNCSVIVFKSFAILSARSVDNSKILYFDISWFCYL